MSNAPRGAGDSPMSTRIELYDTTLRDGSQGEDVSFSVTDKLLIARRLDAFGIDYLEGGWPGSNPKDIEFFKQMADAPLRRAKLTAFGSTRHARHAPEDDPNLLKLIEAATPVVTIFGKSWLLHVKEALRVSADTNLAMIADSVRFLAGHGREVIFDAEHFFDGYCDDAAYALQVLATAAGAGARCLVLCDTNGGSLPHDVARIVGEVCRHLPQSAIGFHGHNDAACGVANALMAVTAGATHLQGTINGIGERCGNTDLSGVLPALMLKMGYTTGINLGELTEISKYVDELANLTPNKRQPYVGLSAFAHKGGIHVSAIQRNPRTYEHLPPDAVGNQRRVLVSELSGQSNVLFKAHELHLELSADPEQTRRVVDEIKRREHLGYEYEAADASFELLVKKALGAFTPSFEVLGFRCIDEDRNGTVVSEATIKVRVAGVEEHTAAEGDGPVHALDSALRKALRPFFPELEAIELIDYKVRVLSLKELAGTASKVRVLVESRDGASVWGTVGVSTNIIEASYEALIDSIEYKLMRHKAAQG